jgi:hypothetical protein
MAGTFSGHVVTGQLLQFAVHERNELLQRLGVAVAPGDEEIGDL